MYSWASQSSPSLASSRFKSFKLPHELLSWVMEHSELKNLGCQISQCIFEKISIVNLRSLFSAVSLNNCFGIIIYPKDDETRKKGFPAYEFWRFWGYSFCHCNSQMNVLYQNKTRMSQSRTESVINCKWLIHMQALAVTLSFSISNVLVVLPFFSWNVS